MQKINFKKLDPNAIVPAYATEFAAGADLYALCDGDVVVAPSETYTVHTGIAMEIPQGMAGFVFARSGLASKRGLAPANKVGVIDSDYRGEIMVTLHNHSRRAQTISCGERIAQLVIMPYITAHFEESDELSETKRANGGFGSTGTK